MKEYDPSEKLEIKRGIFVEMKDYKVVVDYILSNFTHWLEEVK